MFTRRFVFLAGVLVTLNLALWFAGPGLALRKALVTELFGPRMVRAQVHLRNGQDWNLDRGVITQVSSTQLTLREFDGRIQPIPLDQHDQRHPSRPAPAADRTRASVARGRGVAGRRWSRAVGRRREDPTGTIDGARDELARRRHTYPGAVTVQATGGALLLVEDDDAIGRLVKQYLEQQDGWRVVWHRTGEEAIAELRGQPVRLVVLDIGLPGMDGFEVCRQIRAGSKVPIVMLTARDEEPDRVAGLELGADDYVSKPFSPRELSARIKAILRRSESRTEDEVLAAREVVLRRDSHEVTVAGAQVELTSKEFDLLACFLEHPGIVLSRERLLDLVWGMTYPGGTRTVDVHVAQLRRKLGDPEGIRTVRGAGYKLVPA